MQLTGLIPLFRSMRQQEIHRYRFPFQYNQLRFDVFFLTDVKPFVLMFGACAVTQPVISSSERCRISER